MFNENKYNFETRVKHDLFSDYRDSFFDSIGVTEPIRKQVQPVVDKAAPLVQNFLPQGGIQPPYPNSGSESSAFETGFQFQSLTSPNTIILGVVGVLVLIYLLKE